MRLDNMSTREEEKSEFKKEMLPFSFSEKKLNVKLIKNIMYQKKSLRDSFTTP